MVFVPDGFAVECSSFAVDDENFKFTDKEYPFKPSIHMPKEACRLFLKIISIKIERLQDISKGDAIKEGIEPIVDIVSSSVEHRYKNYLETKIYFGVDFGLSPKESFKSLWESIHGKESFDLDPWVWVIEFEKIERPADFI